MSDPRIIVALDYPDAKSALDLASRLDPTQCRLKVGKELFTAAGPSLLEKLHQKGFSVFLDLKYHDIPNTVAQAVEAAVQTGVWMINVHASGGHAMMRAAAVAARDTAERLGRPAPLMIAVTVLTSMDEAALHGVGVERSVLEQVLVLARMTQDAGLQGVVASAQETAAIRAACGHDFQIVTPGIRGATAGSERNDQSRTMGPADAIRAGASYIVVGRPIIAAADPRAAATAIVNELAAG